jgi:hypothetical protein
MDIKDLLDPTPPELLARADGVAPPIVPAASPSHPSDIIQRASRSQRYWSDEEDRYLVETILKTRLALYPAVLQAPAFNQRASRTKMFSTKPPRSYQNEEIQEKTPNRTST